MNKKEQGHFFKQIESTFLNQFRQNVFRAPKSSSSNANSLANIKLISTKFTLTFLDYLRIIRDIYNAFNSVYNQVFSKQQEGTKPTTPAAEPKMKDFYNRHLLELKLSMADLLEELLFLSNQNLLCSLNSSFVALIHSILSIESMMILETCREKIEDPRLARHSQKSAEIELLHIKSMQPVKEMPFNEREYKRKKYLTRLSLDMLPTFKNNADYQDGECCSLKAKIILDVCESGSTSPVNQEEDEFIKNVANPDKTCKVSVSNSLKTIPLIKTQSAELSSSVNSWAFSVTNSSISSSPPKTPRLYRIGSSSFSHADEIAKNYESSTPKNASQSGLAALTTTPTLKNGSTNSTFTADSSECSENKTCMQQQQATSFTFTPNDLINSILNRIIYDESPPSNERCGETLNCTVVSREVKPDEPTILIEKGVLEALEPILGEIQRDCAESHHINVNIVESVNNLSLVSSDSEDENDKPPPPPQIRNIKFESENVSMCLNQSVKSPNSSISQGVKRSREINAKSEATELNNQDQEKYK